MSTKQESNVKAQGSVRSGTAKDPTKQTSIPVTADPTTIKEWAQEKVQSTLMQSDLPSSEQRTRNRKCYSWFIAHVSQYILTKQFVTMCCIFLVTSSIAAARDSKILEDVKGLPLSDTGKVMFL
jgi:hypothetical protein